MLCITHYLELGNAWRISHLYSGVIKMGVSFLLQSIENNANNNNVMYNYHISNLLMLDCSDRSIHLVSHRIIAQHWQTNPLLCMEVPHPNNKGKQSTKYNVDGITMIITAII